jgi:coenzyme PQQ precursor peptide PqqA
MSVGRKIVAWTTPRIEEICVGMEINGYFPAEL